MKVRKRPASISYDLRNLLKGRFIPSPTITLPPGLSIAAVWAGVPTRSHYSFNQECGLGCSPNRRGSTFPCPTPL